MRNENWIKENTSKAQIDKATKAVAERKEWEKDKKVTAVKDLSQPRLIVLKYTKK